MLKWTAGQLLPCGLCSSGGGGGGSNSSSSSKTYFSSFKEITLIETSIVLNLTNTVF